MPLLAFLQLHPREGLEQKAVQFRNVQSGRIDEGVLFASNAADFALVGDRQPDGLCQIVIDAVAARSGIDQGADTFCRKIGPFAGGGSRFEANIDKQGRPEALQEIAWRRSIPAGFKSQPGPFTCVGRNTMPPGS